MKIKVAKARALLELLRIFRMTPDNLSLDEEIEFFNSNYFKLESLINIDNNQNEIKDFKKSFYLKHENHLISFFGIEENVSRMKLDEEEMGINSILGTHLFLHVSLLPEPETKEDFSQIAEEFITLISIYGSYILDEDNRVSSKKSSSSVSVSEFLVSIREQIRKNEIDHVKLVGLLYGLYQKEIYLNLETYPRSIEEEISTLEDTLRLVKPNIDDFKRALYVRFLMDFEEYVPDDYLDRIINIKKYMIKDERCYIATMCYKDYDSKEVVFFQNIRDQYLLNNYVGIIFVKVYYNISPRIVRRIKSKKWLNWFIKNAMLNPLYRILLQLTANDKKIQENIS